MTSVKYKISKILVPLVVGLLFTPSLSIAHSGADPAKELAKKRRYLLQYQHEFNVQKTDEARIQNLRNQISNLQGTVLLLRNSLVKENKLIRKTINEQEINYLLAMKNSLKEMKVTLQQFEEMLDE